MRRLAIFLLLLVLAGIGAGAWWKYGSRQKPPDVRTAEVTRGEIVEQVGATGTLEAVNTVQVGSQVSGNIKELYADFNSIVRKGQVVARLDPSLFETQIEQARANLARAEADVERLRVGVDDARSKLARATELARRNLIPSQELEAAQIAVRSSEAQLRSAQAQVTQAQASLNQNRVNQQHTVIAAPIDGIVISRNVDVGQTVAASMQAPTLFVIAADLAKMKVTAAVDEADVGRIRPGQRVTFRVDAYPTEEFEGRVQQVRLQPQVVQNVVTYATVIDVPNPELKLKPGMTANVNIEIARRASVVRIPNAALRFRPTADTFAALGQAMPPELQRAAGRGGRPGEGAREGAGRASAAAPGATATAAGGAAARTPVARDRATAQPDRPVPPGAPRADAGPAPGSAVADGQRARPAGALPPPGTPVVPTDQGPGAGRRGWGGGPGGEGVSPEERRQRALARLAELPPEERERALQRMRERGFDPSAPLTSAAGAPGVTGESPSRTTPSTRPARTAPAQSATAPQRATTIDALFGPLPPTETTGRAFLYVNNQLKMVRLHLGVTDGTSTEVLAPDLQPGTTVVTAVILDVAASGTGGTARSPLMGPQRGGPPPARNTGVAPGAR